MSKHKLKKFDSNAVDPETMTDAEKTEAYICYRAKKIEDMKKDISRRQWHRTIFFWKYLGGEISPSRQLEYSDFMKDCNDYWTFLYGEHPYKNTKGTRNSA